MKKLLLWAGLSLAAINLNSCAGIKSTTQGLENDSFLMFLGNPSDFEGGLDINLDDKINFRAEVIKDHQDRPKGSVYAISTGVHIITVSFKNQVIYKKQIFVSAQETKKIYLP
jgi:hypothetical protein